MGKITCSCQDGVFCNVNKIVILIIGRGGRKVIIMPVSAVVNRVISSVDIAHKI